MINFMLLKLILLFTIIPLVELALLIEIGSRLGVIFTVILVGITGMIGVTLARSQGFKVINRIKKSLNQGQLPADDLLGGLLILAGGLFLLTPGLLTDLTGFALIIPLTRSFFARILKKKMSVYVDDNLNQERYTFFTGGFSKKDNSQNKNTASEDDVIDVSFSAEGESDKDSQKDEAEEEKSKKTDEN